MPTNDKRESVLYKIINAAGRRKEAENKFKTEMTKIQLESKIRQQEQANKTKMGLASTLIQERAKNPQNYTPEQQYLKRRYMEENPFASVDLPEEGQDVSRGITMPQEEITRDPKTGLMGKQPIGRERQTQLLEEKVRQMEAEGRRPHPAILTLLEKQRMSAGAKFDPVTGKSLQGIEGLSREERLDRQNRLQNLRQYGGTISDEEMRGMGIGLDSYTKAGGATPIIDPKTGKRTWEVKPYDVFKKEISEGKWNKSEIDTFQNAIVENQRWSDVLKTADDLGIGEDDMPYLGSIEFSMVETPYGPFSIPASFNLAGQYLKDPKYTALKRKIETAFAAFRKRVTGAQAGEKELQYLREVMPSLKDRPEVFFEVVHSLIGENINDMDARIEGYKAFGRNTEGIEELVNKYRSEFEMGDDEVEVISPDGKLGTIPASQLEEALKEGYKKA